VSSKSSRPLTLDQFLKFCGVVSSGGQAKLAIQDGYVTVNGELETRRGRKLVPGDVVLVDQKHEFVVPEPNET
jgi:ribosome-associated protein